MRFSPERTSIVGTALRRTVSVRRGLAAALLLALAPAAKAAAQVPGTQPVTNTASATFRGTIDGVEGTTEAAVTVTLETTAGVALAPPREAVVFPGGRRVLAHALQNTGNAWDRFSLEAAGPDGWSVSLYRDLDSDGALDAGEPRITGPLAVDAGATVAILMVADAPAAAPEGQVEVRIRAASVSVAAAAAEVLDRLTVRIPVAALRLTKLVSRATATRGDTLTYTLEYGNGGDAASAGIVLSDTLPAGLRLVAGSLRLNGAAQSDAADADAGSAATLDGGRGLVRFALGTLAPGATGTATFRAVIASDADLDDLRNVAVLAGPGGDAPVVSAPAVTGVGAPVLQLSKTRVSGEEVGFGDEATFRLRVSNGSAELTARAVVLTDTVPAGLVPVSGGPTAEITGQVVRWVLGDLAPGDAVEVELTTRVSEAAQGAALINRAVASGANAEAVAASALPMRVEPLRQGVLEIEKSSTVLEAGLGEAVPYAIVLRNRGLAPLGGVEVWDELPAGMELVKDGVVGADSLRQEGRMVRFFVAGPIAASSEHVIRYALVLVSAGDGGRRANRAWARGAAGLVASDTAEAWVRVRRGNAMEIRTLVGKVWVDANGDGRQQAGEPGLDRVEVWSEDGEVVTTDREGRFSFRDVRRGSHVLRLDTLSLPASVRLAPGQDLSVRVNADGWTIPTVSFRVAPRAGVDSAAVAALARHDAPSVTNESSPRGDSLRAAAREVAPASVTPLRTAAERDDEKARAFTEGEPVRVVVPADGGVVATNRANVRVQGEPGAAVKVFRGDSLVAEGTLRPDGSMDVIGVHLPEGPSVVRAWMRNSWGRERWDSVAVHRSGAPAKIESATDGRIVMRAEDRAVTVVAVRVLDRWGVPVADRPALTVESAAAMLDGADVDGASQGWQVRAGADGVAEVALRPGTTVGMGEVVVTAGDDAELRLPITVMPSARPLIATGAAQIGVGAAPESYGAVVVRGALDRETSVSVTYDSRRANPETEFFDRGYDPADESRYPTLGDESDRRTFGSATQQLSARVERGLDWVELGDISTGDFSGSERLGGYARSLTGAIARVGTGPLTWRAFGSFTDQTLTQQQVRSDGTSGPFVFGRGVRPGTERIAIEVRARDNAARVLQREELVRFYDYQIDYTTGEVKLSRAVPTQDAYGNPVFIVGLLERRSGGDQRFVGGLRLEGDAAPYLPTLGADSLNVAVYGVRDGTGDNGGDFGVGGAADLMGAEMQVRRGGLVVGGEVLRSATDDSTSVAGQAHLRWTLPGNRLSFTGEWLRVGEGFASSMNPRLQSGLEELRLGSEWRPGRNALFRLRHERQNFREYGVERQTTTLATEQKVAGRRVTAQAGVITDEQESSGSSTTALGRANLAVTDRTDLWLEGSHQLSGDEGAGRPDQVGLGLTHAIYRWLRLEGSWRWAQVDPDSGAYSVSGLNLKTLLPLGAQAWGGVERTMAGEAQHAAVLGWNQRVTLRGGWSINGLLERRFGLERAPLTDPVRALPFPQVEREMWAGALGVDFLSETGPRLSYRGEFHDGELRTGWRFDLGGDLAFGRNGAILTRHDWSEDKRAEVAGGGRELTRSERSMVGLAFRPANTETLNVLAKLEWRYSLNPLAGTVLAGSSREERLIAATDAVWQPLRGFTFAGRYALRRTMARDSVEALGTIRSTAHFVSGRLEQAFYRGLRARLDARMLAEGVTGAERWSVAPSLTLGLGGGLEAEGGYRFGTLEDADFARYGQKGFFAVLGFRFTEGTLNSAADFWRQRVNSDQ